MGQIVKIKITMVMIIIIFYSICQFDFILSKPIKNPLLMARNKDFSSAFAEFFSSCRRIYMLNEKKGKIIGKSSDQVSKHFLGLSGWIFNQVLKHGSLWMATYYVTDIFLPLFFKALTVLSFLTLFVLTPNGWMDTWIETGN